MAVLSLCAVCNASAPRSQRDIDAGGRAERAPHRHGLAHLGDRAELSERLLPYVAKPVGGEGLRRLRVEKGDRSLEVFGAERVGERAERRRRTPHRPAR